MWGFFVIAPVDGRNTSSPPSSTHSTASRCWRTCSPARRSAPASSPPSLILAVMVIPFIAATMRDVFETVPPVYKESAYGVGCTTWEVMRSIVIPYTRVSVVGGIMLGLGRALGETMAVTFVIGNTNRISHLAVRPRQHHRLDRRAGVSRKPGRQPEAFLAAGARLHPVRDLVHRAGDLAAAAAPAVEGMSMSATMPAGAVPGPAKNRGRRIQAGPPAASGQPAGQDRCACWRP